jgi:uncharacterized protein YbjT (DUF2867 family)
MRIAVAGATGRVGRHIVDVLTESGHDVVPMSRTTGVDLVTGDGLPEALTGVEKIIDAATGPADEAMEFFTAATRNMQRAGERAGVRGIVVVSIIGIDRLNGAYSLAKLEHERAMLAGPLPVTIARAAQFHEFVGQMMEWGRQGDVVYVPRMKTRAVAARGVAEALVPVATDDEAPSLVEIAGPRVENMVDLTVLLAAHRGDQLKVEEVSDPVDGAAFESGALLPGPGAVIVGPTFEEWLSAPR